jgi:hypothetical protein
VKDVHIVFGVAAIALNAVAGIYGAWCWRRAESKPLFWRILRAAQASLVVEAGLGGIYAATGHKVSNIHLLYGLLPIAISFVAETLRISTAQMVLDARGFTSAAEVGELEPDDQRRIVVTIVQREVGVMAAAAIVIVVLLARAAGTG